MKIKVLTFNTLGFTADAAADTATRKQAIVQALDALACDFVFLQEIKTLWARGGPPSHRSEDHFRASKVYGAGCYFVYADQRPQSQNAEGLLSRHALQSFEFGSLPANLFGRGYLLARARVGDATVQLLTTHLEPPALGRMVTSYGATPEGQAAARARQFERLEQIAGATSPEWPLIVGGDFNTGSDDPTLASWVDRLGLRPVLPDSPERPIKTFATHPSPSFDVGLEQRLDHLFFRSGTLATLTLLAEGLAFDKPRAPASELFFGYLSDHCGLYGEFELASAMEHA